jgi:hypothetical protein
MATAYSSNIVNDGLVFYYDMGNGKKSWKGAPTTNLQLPNVADWTNTAVVTLLSEISPIKTSVYGITDNNSGSYLSSIRNITVPNDSNTYTISIYIKKTFGATSARLGFNCGFTGGTPVQFFPRFNSDTGIGNTGSSDDLGFWWRWKFSMTNNSTGNTTLYCQFYPATGFYNSSDNAAATGTATVSSVQIEQSTFATPFVNGTRSNTQAIRDLTNNNTITATSLTYASDGTFSFNGSSNFISVPNSSSLQVADVFTVNTWVNATDLTTNRFGIFSTRTANASGSWQLEVGTGNGGQRRIVVTGVGTWIWESSNDVIAVNTWCNICFVKPSNATQGGSLYLNGNLLTPLTTTAYTILNNNDAKVIGQGTNGVQFFPGRIDSVNLYNRALSAAEVQQNFRALRGRYGI